MCTLRFVILLLPHRARRSCRAITSLLSTESLGPFLLNHMQASDQCPNAEGRKGLCQSKQVHLECMRGNDAFGDGCCCRHATHQVNTANQSLSIKMRSKTNSPKAYPPFFRLSHGPLSRRHRSDTMPRKLKAFSKPSAALIFSSSFPCCGGGRISEASSSYWKDVPSNRSLFFIQAALFAPVSLL